MKAITSVLECKGVCEVTMQNRIKCIVQNEFIRFGIVEVIATAVDVEIFDNYMFFSSK